MIIDNTICSKWTHQHIKFIQIEKHLIQFCCQIRWTGRRITGTDEHFNRMLDTVFKSSLLEEEKKLSQLNYCKISGFTISTRLFGLELAFRLSISTSRIQYWVLTFTSAHSSKWPKLYTFPDRIPDGAWPRESYTEMYFIHFLPKRSENVGNDCSS